MYRLLKEEGSWSNVILKNEDTEATLNLGRVGITMLSTLEEMEGISTTAEDERNLIEISTKWNFDIEDSTAKELTKIAMPMKKPARSKTVKSEQKKESKHVDALDVLLGLADY